MSAQIIDLAQHRRTRFYRPMMLVLLICADAWFGFVLLIWHLFVFDPGG